MPSPACAARLVQVEDRSGAQFQLVAIPFRRSRDQQRLARFQQGGGWPASTSGNSITSNMPVGSEKETKAYICSLRPRAFRFLDQGAGDPGLEAGAAAVFHQRGIGHRAQPLQGRAIGIQRMAGEIEAHGGEIPRPAAHAPASRASRSGAVLPPAVAAAEQMTLVRFRARAAPPAPRPGCGRNSPPTAGGWD